MGPFAQRLIQPSPNGGGGDFKPAPAHLAAAAPQSGNGRGAAAARGADSASDCVPRAPFTAPANKSARTKRAPVAAARGGGRAEETVGQPHAGCRRGNRWPLERPQMTGTEGRREQRRRRGRVEERRGLFTREEMTGEVAVER